MSEDTVVRGCSPTLAALKTGNLFPVEADDHLAQDVRRMNRILVPKGLKMIAIRQWRGPVLVYVWRQDRLRRDLERPQARALLAKLGYRDGRTALQTLVRRFAHEGSFPHEVGLFLGYPAEDVAAFITQQGRNCRLTGCWKVYGDPSHAAACFQAYRRCTDIYCRLSRKGIPLEKLAVKEKKS